MLIKDDLNKCPSVFHGSFSDPYFIERLLLIIYAIIFFIGLVGNIMTIIIIKYNTHLRTPTNFYLLNLAVSDLMMLMCNLPLEMIEIHYREWPLSIIFCKLRNICAEFFTCSSILTILAFSCERYFAIVHPLHFYQLSHFRRAQSMILIIWFISLIFSLPLGLSYEIEENSTILITYSSKLNFSIDSNTKFVRSNETIPALSVYCKSCVPKKSVAKLLSIIMIITSLCFFYFPMLIIGAIYLFIGKALRHANKYDNHSEHNQSSLSASSSCSTLTNKQISIAHCHSSNKEAIEMKQQSPHIGSYSWLKTRARYQARQVVVKTLVAVVIAFFVCYAPLYLQRLLSAIMGLNPNLASESYLFGSIMAYLYVISGMTFYFGSVINPILYNVVSNKYRRAFRDLVFCRLTCKTKSNIKNQRKCFQVNRSNNQQIRYCVQQQEQHNDSPKLCLESKQQRTIDQQTITFTMIKRPVIANTPSSRSNSSSISSRHMDHYPSRANHSNASSPKHCQVQKTTKFSLRRKLLGQKQPTETLPWLATKSRA